MTRPQLIAAIVFAGLVFKAGGPNPQTKSAVSAQLNSRIETISPHPLGSKIEASNAVESIQAEKPEKAITVSAEPQNTVAKVSNTLTHQAEVSKANTKETVHSVSTPANEEIVEAVPVVTATERVRRNAVVWGEKGDRHYEAGQLKSARGAYINSRDLFASIAHPQAASQTQWAIDKIDAELRPTAAPAKKKSDDCGFWCRLTRDTGSNISNTTEETVRASRRTEKIRNNAIDWREQGDRNYDAGRLRQAHSAYTKARDLFKSIDYIEATQQTQWAIDKIDSELAQSAIAADQARLADQVAKEQAQQAESARLEAARLEAEKLETERLETERLETSRRAQQTEIARLEREQRDLLLLTVATPSNNSDSGRSTGFVAGTCKELRALGLSDFRPSDVNYSPRRDRDNDGIACES